MQKYFPVQIPHKKMSFGKTQLIYYMNNFMKQNRFQYFHVAYIYSRSLNLERVGNFEEEKNQDWEKVRNLAKKMPKV